MENFASSGHQKKLVNVGRTHSSAPETKTTDLMRYSRRAVKVVGTIERHPAPGGILAGHIPRCCTSHHQPSFYW